MPRPASAPVPTPASAPVIVLRALVVLFLVFGVLLVKRLYAQWRRGVGDESRPHPRVPAGLLAGASRTWLVFTTPYCASCGPVERHLRSSDPEARVVKIDATRQPRLAEEFGVRSAPTVLLADGRGDVQARLVGAEAVDAYVRNPT